MIFPATKKLRATARLMEGKSNNVHEFVMLEVVVMSNMNGVGRESYWALVDRRVVDTIGLVQILRLQSAVVVVEVVNIPDSEAIDTCWMEINCLGPQDFRAMPFPLQERRSVPLWRSSQYIYDALIKGCVWEDGNSRVLVKSVRSSYTG